MIQLDPRTTALVVIDLQKGIAGRQTAPHAAADVINTTQQLATNFRKEGAPVVLVNVTFAKDRGDALRQPVDRPMPRPADMAPDWSELVEGLAGEGDIHVTKHQWGALYGTDLDVHLRRRGIKTIVLGGIATNMGVESTARQAWERGYEVVIVEDMTSSISAEMHEFAVSKIFPLLSRVTKAAEISLVSSAG